MGIWTELVGVRKDLHLKGKWWHHLATGAAVLGGLVVYLIAAGIVARRAVRPTNENTFSLTLLTHAISRSGTTTLADLDALAGSVAKVAKNGDLVPLERTGGSGGLRCVSRARYKENEPVTIDRVSYQAIPDFPGQAANELRHCVAVPAYAGLTAKSIVVYVPDGTGTRKQSLKGGLAGIAMVMVFLMLYWNVYYRGLMPFYARHRRARRARRQARFEVR